MKRIVILICIVVAIALGVVVAKINRGEHQALIETLGVMLRVANQKYLSADPRDTEKLKQIIAPNGSFQPVVFTKVIAISGTNYHCQLAVEFLSLGKSGTLAVTTNDILILIDRKNHASIVSFPKISTRAPNQNTEAVGSGENQR